MTIDDPILPAACHLSGPFAEDVLRAAVEAAGGELASFRCTGLQYRPGSDLVARFRADVAWHGGAPTKDTLMAATTISGPPEGTLPVTAETPTCTLSVGVWRWPFDPSLPGLGRAVRKSGAADILRDAGLLDPASPVDVEVVAYRPIERAVVRIRNGDQTFYLKVVRPERASAMVSRHGLLAGHGVPVPMVAASDPEQGLIVLRELAGPTLRELIKSDAPRWVEPDNYRALVRDLSACDSSGLPGVRSRTLDAPIHASVLATVLPQEQPRLERLAATMNAALEASDRRPRTVVHGDLHEGQILIDDGRIAGLLDIDDIGPGDPIDDVVVPVGHLRYRASLRPGNARRIEQLAADLLEVFASDFPRADLAVGIAAVLIGIATGPFRLQHPDWPASVGRVLDLAEQTLD